MWFNCCNTRTLSVNEEIPPLERQDSSPQIQQNPPLEFESQNQRYEDSPRIPDGGQSFEGDNNEGGALEPTRRSYLGGLFIQNQLIEWRRGPAIGEGGFSRVYKAWSETHGKYIAVKEIFAPNRGRQYTENLKMFENEVANLAQLKHPFIVKYLGCERDEQSEQVRVFMEYVGSTSVNNHIQQFGEFSEEQGRRICYQVLQGLHYLHLQNIIHRDIKGSNILVSDYDGNAKLVDFGVSKQLKNVMQQNGDTSQAVSVQPIGTPLWWAPEVWKGGAHSKASDVWSLGATFIEMIIADNPWAMHNSTLLSVLNSLSQKSSGPAIPEKLSEVAKDFLGCCLDWNPKKRSNTAQLLKHKFFKPEVVQRVGSIQKEICGPSTPTEEQQHNKKSIMSQRSLPVLRNTQK